MTATKFSHVRILSELVSFCWMPVAAQAVTVFCPSWSDWLTISNYIGVPALLLFLISAPFLNGESFGRMTARGELMVHRSTRGYLATTAVWYGLELALVYGLLWTDVDQDLLTSVLYMVLVQTILIAHTAWHASRLEAEFIASRADQLFN